MLKPSLNPALAFVTLGALAGASGLVGAVPGAHPPDAAVVSDAADAADDQGDAWGGGKEGSSSDISAGAQPQEPPGVYRSAVIDDDVPTCPVTMRRSIGALNVATYFSWYRSRDQFKCMSSKPIEGFFRSANRRHIRRHLVRLRDHGFDAIAGVVYEDPLGEGKPALEMQWMLRAVREARRLGFGFIPLYDFSIASHLSANLCNVFAGRCTPDDVRVEEYNFDRYPVLQRTVVDNLVMIADRFILPFADLEDPSSSTARFLHDATGEVVLDEKGLPRPEVYIYIPRVWMDDSDFATVAGTLAEVTEAYRERGLGMPAYTLDVLMPLRKPFSVKRLAAFGESAVRLTPFFAATDKADNLGDLSREHRKMYRRARRILKRAINRGRVHSRLQIAGGTVVNFDKRGWSACQQGFHPVYWPARNAGDWVEALETMVEHTTEPVCSDNGLAPDDLTPFQNGRFVYADEGFEATWLCAEEGPDGPEYPNRYGCEPLEGFLELMRALGERPR